MTTLLPRTWLYKKPKIYAITVLFFLAIPVSLGSERSKWKHFQALQKRARYLLQENQLRASIPYLRRMVHIQPYNEAVFFWLAQALLYQKKGRDSETFQKELKEAILFLEKCVRIHRRIDLRSPLLARRLFHLGMAYWYAAKPQQALQAFRRSYRADTRLLAALYNQAALTQELGYTLRAHLLYKQYIEASGNRESSPVPARVQGNSYF